MHFACGPPVNVSAGLAGFPLAGLLTYQFYAGFVGNTPGRSYAKINQTQRSRPAQRIRRSR